MKFSDLVLDVEVNTDGKIVVVGDREMTEATVTISEDGMAMMKAGYLCANCFEDFAKSGVGAFPEVCPVCHFRVSDEQARRLALKDVGEVELGSRLSINEELERMKDPLWLPGDPI